MLPNKPKRKFVSLFAIILVTGALLACNLSKLLSKSNLFEGAAMQEAAAAFKTKIGGPIKALSLEIQIDSATLRAQDPKNPQHVDEYKYLRGLVTGPTPVQLSGAERNLEKTLFSLDDVNLAATAALAKGAVDRTRLEGGKVTKMVIERGVNLNSLLDGSASELTKSAGVSWMVSVEGAREQASIVANTKGEIVGVDLSQTAAAAGVNFYEGDAMSKAASKIRAALGDRAKILVLTIYDKYVWFSAQDPQKPGEFNQYKYDINGLSRSGAADMNAILGPRNLKNKVEDFIFDLDEADFAKTPDLAKDALDKLRITDGHIDLMTISRGHWGKIRDDNNLKWQVSVRGPRQKNGFVFYDGKGNLNRVKATE